VRFLAILFHYCDLANAIFGYFISLLRFILANAILGYFISLLRFILANAI
jgi:hypothetical protein